MARADPRLIDARTDVYLLGGVLFEVLTGRVPHEAPTVVAALVLALRGEVPAFPADLPAELADLARRAMAPAAEDRVAGAEAFREGLAQFLASREVDRAVAEARLALSRARELISKDGPSSLDAFRALVEARITFASAHRARPKDATIRADLDATLGHLVERELVLRSPIGARAVLAELGTPSPDLQSRVATLEAQLIAEREAVEAHLEARADADLAPALRLGAWFLVGALGLELLSPAGSACGASPTSQHDEDELTARPSARSRKSLTWHPRSKRRASGLAKQGGGVTTPSR
jgi:hypothetical protein